MAFQPFLGVAAGGTFGVLVKLWHEVFKYDQFRSRYMKKAFRYFELVSLVILGIFCPVAVNRADDSSDSNQQTQFFVAQVKNEVYVVHQGNQHAPNPPEALAENDWVRTGANSTAYLEFQNGGIVEVGPNSNMKVGELDITPTDFKARFLLSVGEFKAKVAKLMTASSVFEVQAGGVVCGVRGTIFGVDYDETQNKISALTYEGTIFTRSGGKEELVEKGYGLAVDQGGAPSVSALTQGQVQSFEQFSDVAGLLEQKKQEMIDDMKNRALQQVPQNVLPGQNNIQNAIGQKLGF
jgi:hypothetical protein